MKQEKRNLKKNAFSLFVSLLFIFSFIPFISSTASFYAIPDVNLEYNTIFTVNLNDYCVSNQQGNSCRFTSYGVSFSNPDNNNNVFLFPSESSSNSFFSVNLNANGRVTVSSNSKNLNTIITVYGADVDYSSQASGSFNLNIAQSQLPEQIASFFVPVITGNDTIAYSLNNFFLNYNKIRVNYNDDVLNRNVQFENSFSSSGSCTIGQISVCLTSGQDNIVLQISGLNISYNSSVTGGNILVITAINQYGEVSDVGFPVVVTPTGIVTYSAIPTRAPFTIAPANIGYNQSYNFDLKILYGNFTYVNITFNTKGNNYALIIYQNGSGEVCPFPVACTIFPASNISNAGGFIGVGLTNTIGVRLFQSFILQPNSFRNLSGTGSLNINLSACNNIGCVNSDGFGNKDILYVNVSGTPPEGIPFTFAPIEIGFGETKVFNFNDMFSNFDYLILNWSETSENFSVRTPNITLIQNISQFISGGVPVYQTKLFFTNFFSVTSGTQSHNFTVYPVACNSVSCIIGTLGVQQSITFIIRDIATEQFGTSQVSDNLFRNMYNVIFGLFPDGDGLTSPQKNSIAFIAIALVFGLILFFGFKSGGNILPLVYLGGIVSFFVFVFFTVKGYLNPIIMVVLGILGVGAFILKVRNGGGG